MRLVPRLGRALQRYRDEAGVTYVLARVQWPGVSQEIALRGIKALGERVLLAASGRRRAP